jgi:chemotaxis protein CheX
MNQSATPTSDAAVEGVSTQTVHDLVAAIWSAMLSLDLALSATPAIPAQGEPDGAESVVGTISITGGWDGWVELSGSTTLATVASAAMLMTEPGDLEPGDIWDGWAELTNMVGGSVKALLPEPSALSLPTVTTHGSVLRPGGPSGLLAAFDSAGERFTVRVVPASHRNGSQQ